MQTITRWLGLGLRSAVPGPCPVGRSELPVEALRHLPERQLPKGGQVLGSEEVLQGLGDPVGPIDLSRREPLQQIFDGQIEGDHLIGLLKEGVGHRLADRDAGRALDQLVERLEVLDAVEGAEDVDAGGQHVQHVLVAPPILAARGVGVGDLVDERDLGVAGQDPVEIELLHRDTTVLDGAQRDLLEACKQRGGLGASMGLDQGHGHVPAPGLESLGVLQHAVGLSHSRREADVDLEPSALGALDQLEEVFRAAVVLDRHG